MAHEAPQVLPVIVGAADSFEERLSIEGVLDLPQLEDRELAQERAVEGHGREAVKVVQVADLGALERCPNLLAHHLVDGERAHPESLELEVVEIRLVLEGLWRHGERGALAQADLEPEVPGGIPRVPVEDLPSKGGVPFRLV